MLVCNIWGMSPDIGPVVYDTIRLNVYEFSYNKSFAFTTWVITYSIEADNF